MKDKIEIFLNEFKQRFLNPLRKIWYRLINYREERKWFKRAIGYELDLDSPRSFTEKVVWKKINDRNPLLPLTADKYKVRDYIREKLGEQKASEILIPLIFETKNPQKISFDELPESYVIKANHGSGKNIIIRPDTQIDSKEVIRECELWLHKTHGFHDHQWAYQQIDRRVLVEEFLTTDYGEIPEDYKLYIFHENCKLIHVDFDRYENHRRSLFTPDWDYIPVRYGYPKGPEEVKPPEKLAEMIEISERLGQDFDFVRVDLYNMGKEIFFGELTHYPGGGHEKFYSKSFDFELGEHWNIEEKYWKK